MKAILSLARTICHLSVLACQIGCTVSQVFWLSVSVPQNRRWWRKHWQDEKKRIIRDYAKRGIDLHRLTWRQALHLLALAIKLSLKSFFTKGGRGQP